MPFEPTFRVFANHQKTPPLGQRLRWDRHQETLDKYLAELRTVFTHCVENGGHDCEIIQSLFLEGLIETIAHFPPPSSQTRVVDRRRSSNAIPKKNVKAVSLNNNNNDPAASKAAAAKKANVSRNIAICYALFKTMIDLEKKASNLMHRAM